MSRISIKINKLIYKNILTSFRVFRRQYLESLSQKDCCRFSAVLSAIVYKTVNVCDKSDLYVILVYYNIT